MYDVNRITLLGRVGATPLCRITKTGKNVTVLSIATHRRIREGIRDGIREGVGKEGQDSSSATEFREETDWHRVVAWGSQAEYAGKHLKKGQTVYVEGRLQKKKYKTKEGDLRYMSEVIAEKLSGMHAPAKTAFEKTQEVADQEILTAQA